MSHYVQVGKPFYTAHGPCSTALPSLTFLFRRSHKNAVHCPELKCMLVSGSVAVSRVLLISHDCEKGSEHLASPSLGTRCRLRLLSGLTLGTLALGRSRADQNAKVSLSS